MIEAMFSIENLIEIVKAGGKVKTGVDVYNEKGILLLEKNIVVDKIKPLHILQQNGVLSVPVNSHADGGLWDGKGNLIRVGSDGQIEFVPPLTLKKSNAPALVSDYRTDSDIEKRLLEIQTIKKEAVQQYDAAKKCLQKAFQQVRETQGQFDVQEVESRVSKLVDFSVAADHPFPYLNREIFFYDDYLYRHSTNVCALATAVLHRFNTHFSHTIDNFLSENKADISGGGWGGDEAHSASFVYYYGEDLNEISLGFFLYDIGKAMVPETLLNKTSRLTDKEFEIMKRHSFDYGARVLEANGIRSCVLNNIVRYHHAPLFENEEGCYPLDKASSDIPLYVRICKLADIYDAMTSKRSYNDALNQVGAVTQLFRKYVKKDPMLQFVLRAFVKSVGLYPPGSIVYLKNGQMAYVLESNGPLVITFTDDKKNTLGAKPDPIDLGRPGLDELLKIDMERSVKTPKEVYRILPRYIKNIATPI
ncbi:MAG: HD domain-containing protein [Desulfobacteraceae bacterium]|nr:HD domain-containing protein [Desulfobacteraceae bacterium]